MDERFKKLKKNNFGGNNTPQTNFIRKDYTNKIYSCTGNRIIKTLTGQRRIYIFIDEVQNI